MSELIKSQLAESLRLEASGEADPDKRRHLSEAAEYLFGNDKRDWENAVWCLVAMVEELRASIRELAVDGNPDEYEAASALIGQINALITEEKTKHPVFWMAGLFRH